MRGLDNRAYGLLDGALQTKNTRAQKYRVQLSPLWTLNLSPAAAQRGTSAAAPGVLIGAVFAVTVVVILELSRDDAWAASKARAQETCKH